MMPSRAASAGQRGQGASIHINETDTKQGEIDDGPERFIDCGECFSSSGSRSNGGLGDGAEWSLCSTEREEELEIDVRR